MLQRLLLGAGLLTIACAPTASPKKNVANYSPPLGYRYEAREPVKNADGTPSYVISQYGEAHTNSAPEKVPVWRTRPGAQTGDYLHEPMSPEYIGTRPNNQNAMLQVMGMIPADNQYVYQTATSAPKKNCPPPPIAKTQNLPTPSCSHAATASANRDANGFSPNTPEWLHSDYYGLTPEQKSLLEKATKKCKKR